MSQVKPTTAPRRLRDKSLVPKNGWVALQHDGTIIKGSSLSEVQRKVALFRVANGVPIDQPLNLLVESQVCDALGDDEATEHCVYSDDGGIKKCPKNSLINFGKAVLGTAGVLVKGEPVCVDEETAEARAVICAQCPHNANIGNCWGCGELGKLFRLVQGDLTTQRDSKLNSCGVCGCALRTKVWITDEALVKIENSQGLPPNEFPVWCWRRKD